MGNQGSGPVDGLGEYIADDRGFYIICRQIKCPYIYLYGLPYDHPVISTITDSIDRTLPGNVPICHKHGYYTTKFTLGSGWTINSSIFTPGSTFRQAGKGKVLFNEIIRDLMNLHGYRPAFSTDLSRYKDRCTIYFEKISGPICDADIACLTISHDNKIQLMCQADHFESLKGSLQTITKEHLDNVWHEPFESRFDRGWVISELTLPFDCWGYRAVGAYKMTGRLLVARLLFHLGRLEGWNFLVNANIKETADYMWFVRGRDGNSIIPPNYTPISGFDMPSIVDASIIMLGHNDKLRLVNFPDYIHGIVEETIDHIGWPIQQISNKKYHERSHEIKLRGYPWWTSGLEAVRSRILIMRICIKLMEHGFRVRTSLDLSRKLDDKANIVFTPCPRIYNVKALMISGTGLNHLRMIGNISTLEENIFRSAVQVIWPESVRRYANEKLHLPQGELCVFAELNGHPWRSSNANEMLHARRMMMFILIKLQELGWILLCSADVSAKCVRNDDSSKYSVDCHTWFMIRYNESRVFVSDGEDNYDSLEPPSYFSLFGV